MVALAVNGTYLYGRLRPGSIDPNNMNAYKNLQFIPLMLLVLDLMIFFPGWHRDRQLKWLEQHGQRVTAQITSIRENNHVSMNYRSPMVIYAVWQDPATHQNYSYHSPNLWFDPQPRLSGPTIEVVIDPLDPKKYYMDVHSLYAARPADPYPQQRQLQNEVEQLKQQVSDLQKKQKQQ